MGNINISPSGVDAASQAIQELANEATGNASHCADASMTAAQANPGWASSTSLTNCANAWAQHLDGMVTEMATFADLLSESSASYNQTEADISAGFQQVLQEFAQNTWSAG